MGGGLPRTQALRPWAFGPSSFFRHSSLGIRHFFIGVHPRSAPAFFRLVLAVPRDGGRIYPGHATTPVDLDWRGRRPGRGSLFLLAPVPRGGGSRGGIHALAFDIDPLTCRSQEDMSQVCGPRVGENPARPARCSLRAV